MKSLVLHLILGLSLLVWSGCSSQSTLQEEPPVTTDSEEPMRFGQATTGTERPQTATRAAGQQLEQGFIVSTYKRYGASGQQTVMDRYEALYRTNAWNNSSSWNTVGTESEGFYQTQYERYWDLSAFPYRFHALSPCPAQMTGARVSDFTLSDTELKMPATATYTFETVDDGTKSAGSEPYLVAQVNRDAQGKDTDLLQSTLEEINGSGGHGLTRTVALPFHHLTAKVRFGIYTLTHYPETANLPIKDVKITATSADGFVTSAGAYEATAAGFLQGRFTQPTHADAAQTLLQLSGPAGDARQEAYLQKHVLRSTTDVNAYFFECGNGILQIPQTGVKIHVCLTIGEGAEAWDIDTDLKLTAEDGSVQTTFDWHSNICYTYYIIIGQVGQEEITFSATLADWEDVNASFEADLEK